MTSRPPNEALRTRLRDVHADGRMSEALLGIALDALEPYAADYLSADDYRSLCEVLSEPVERAREAALGTLAVGLAYKLGEGDPALLARTESIRRRSL